MLRELQIRNLVLIEDVSLTFDRGFNVLTGETGAGKSLIATSLDLLLGKRATSELVRRDAQEAEVEGIFDIGDEPGVRAALSDAGLPTDDELLIRRIIPAEGRHRVYVNGKLASLNVLSELTSGLASTLGQHAHHDLFDAGRQLALLDGFAQNAALLNTIKTAYETVQRIRHELDALRQRETDRTGRIDYVRYQLEELDGLHPQPGEMATIERELDILRHQTLLLETTHRCADELYEDDGSVYERLGHLTRAIDGLIRYDTSLQEDARQLSEAAVLIEEAARSISGYSRRLEADPERLETLSERREELLRLSRKHGVSPDDLPGIDKSLRHELSTLTGYEEAMTTLQTDLQQAERTAREIAQRLTTSRHKAAIQLSRAVTRELSDLAFDRARFEVALSTQDAFLTATGMDRVEFTVSLNPGEGAHSLRRVASGGELSRMMLAIKHTLAGVGPSGTFVFDEIDAGIGGNVAAAVATRLAEVAAHHQLICITHLPRIAAAATAHFHIHKTEEQGRTITRVIRLTDIGRETEIARMLGGDAESDAILQAARELLQRPSVARKPKRGKTCTGK